jgi:hypothetical protein
MKCFSITAHPLSIVGPLRLGTSTGYFSGLLGKTSALEHRQWSALEPWKLGTRNADPVPSPSTLLPVAFLPGNSTTAWSSNWYTMFNSNLVYGASRLSGIGWKILLNGPLCADAAGC